MTQAELAPAKVNLTLHVTGQRDDGYHLLDSLVVFTDMGDTVRLGAAPGLTLTGAEGADLAQQPDNLVLRAARLMGMPDAGLVLDKRLPVASGIGGGSSDAAATMRLLARAHHLPLPPLADQMRLGADVPVCMAARPARMQGVGEQVSAIPPLPPLWLVLVNPRQAVSTPAVFRALAQRHNPAMPDTLPRWRDFADLAVWLGAQRNDLEAPALALAPAIVTVLAHLRAQTDCAFARMSGSGATCFGMFPSPGAARNAADAVRAAQPSWWVTASGLHAAP